MDVDIELPDADTALVCGEEPMMPTDKRLGGRDQYHRAPSCLLRDHDTLDGRVKLENPDSVKAEGHECQEEATAGTEASMEQEDHGTGGDERQRLHRQAAVELYTKLAKMMSRRSVVPPPLPDAEPENATAEAVEAPPEGQGDGEAAEGDEDAGGAPEGEVGAVDDGGDVEKDLELIREKGVSPLSMGAPWPTGSHLGAACRIKKTINSYVDALGDPKWFEEFILGTVHALHRRYQKHKPSIIGKCSFEVQLAYAQVGNRLAALITLHKTIKSWIEAQVDMLLQETLAPFSVMVSYFLHSDSAMSEELNIILTYATFQGMSLKLESVAHAIETFDVSILTHISELAKAKPEEPAPEATPAVKAEEGSTATASAGTGTKRGKTAKESIKRAGEELKQRAAIGQTPIYHLSVMVSEAVRTWITELPEWWIKDELKAYDLVVEIEVIVKQWDAKERNMRTDLEDDTFSEVLRSFAVIAKCAHHTESARPSSSDARHARRVILDQVRQPSSPASELARTLQAYPVGKAMMEASRLHVAQSIEDDAATGKFEASSKRFESHFAECVDDLPQWIARMRRTSVEDGFGFIDDLFKNMCPFFASAHGAIQKWSAASVHSNLDYMASNLSNSMDLIRIGRYMLIDIWGELVLPIMPTLNDALLARTNGYDIQGGDDGHPLMDMDQKSEHDEAIMEVKASHDKTIEHFSATAVLVKESITSFGNTLTDIDTRWENAKVALLGRVGEVIYDKLPEEFVSNPVKLQSSIGHATDLLKEMLTFMEYRVKLTDMKAHVMQIAEQQEEFTNTAVKFAGMLNWMNREIFEFDADSLATDQCRVLKVSDVFRQFVNDVGTPIYTDAADNFVNGLLAEIAPKLSFGLGEVSESVVREIAQEQAFARLVTDADITAVLLPGVAWADGSQIDDAAVEAVPYNKAFSDLVSFMQAGSISDILIPGASKDGLEARMPVDLAKLYLDIVTQVKDLAGIAAQLHSNLYMDQKASEEDMFGKFTHAQRMMGRALARMDKLLSSKEVHEFEKQGWALTVTPQSARQWISALAVYSCSCRNQLFKNLEAVLQCHSKACKGILPELDAAVDSSGRFNEKLGLMLFNNQQGVVNAYNKVRKSMSHLVRAGKLLELVPTVAEHDLTAEAVATGVTCMAIGLAKGRSAPPGAKANQVVAMTRGVQMLEDLKTSPTGPARAAALLERYKTDMAKDVPTCFWAEFEAISAEDRGAPAAVGAEAPPAADGSSG
ncbi:unnamed protein product [Prorocentrum cordatum]|uniref:Exocyst complex component Sec6 n=1 Tax=Prorocentrum cordatum TaxID=2364126 RepID=A0ABN9W2B9_9DINO|nr:unnamed protein product [Polarella glacialis]